MDIRDLNEDQLNQVKQSYYVQKRYPLGVSYDELVTIGFLVSDEEVFSRFDGVDFVEEDFWE